MEYLVRKKSAHLLLAVFAAKACSLSVKQVPLAALMALREKWSFLRWRTSLERCLAKASSLEQALRIRRASPMAMPLKVCLEWREAPCTNEKLLVGL